MQNVRISNLKTTNDPNTAKQANLSFLERKTKMAAHKYMPPENSGSGDMSESAILSN